jgi:hypothetical protein
MRGFGRRLQTLLARPKDAHEIESTIYTTNFLLSPQNMLEEKQASVVG